MLKLRENIYFALLCLLVLTMLTSYYSTIPIILLALFFLLDKKTIVKNKVIEVIKHPITWGLAVYFLIHLIGYLCSINSKFALKEMTQRLSYLILPTIILSEKISNKNLEKLLQIFSRGVIIVLSFLTTYHFIFFQKNISSFVYFGYKLLNISPFYYSVFIFVAMKISLELKSKFFGLELVILFLFLFLLGNRTSILFILLYLGYVFIKDVKLNILKKSISILGLIIITGISFFFSDSLRKKTNVFFKTINFDIETIQTKNSVTITKNTLEHRILIWSLAKELMSENPLGVGVSRYKAELFNKYKEINFKAAMKNKFNTHNQYIEEVLKFGVIWGGVFIYLIWLLIKQYLDNKIVLPVFLLVLLLSFFESFWYRHHGVLIICFIIPLLHIYNEQKNKYKVDRFS